MSKPSGFNIEYDIFPLGEFETVPVSSVREPISENYPEVVCLNKKTDLGQLKLDFLNFNRSGDYFNSRSKFFKNNLRETIKLFEDLGFNRKNYKVYPLREIGTNRVLCSVGDYTKLFLENFGVNLFRQQYVVAKQD